MQACIGRCTGTSQRLSWLILASQGAWAADAYSIQEVISCVPALGSAVLAIVSMHHWRFKNAFFEQMLAACWILCYPSG